MPNGHQDYSRRLPLRQPSALTEPALAKNIYTLIKGTVGEILAVFTATAMRVIRSDKKRIDRQIPGRTDYIPPSAQRGVGYSRLMQLLNH